MPSEEASVENIEEVIDEVESVDDDVDDVTDEVLRQDLIALNRIRHSIAIEKQLASPTLLPFFVTVENALGKARESVRKRAAADAELVKSLVAEAKKPREGVH